MTRTLLRINQYGSNRELHTQIWGGVDNGWICPAEILVDYPQLKFEYVPLLGSKTGPESISKAIPAARESHLLLSREEWRSGNAGSGGAVLGIARLPGCGLRTGAELSCHDPFTPFLEFMDSVDEK